MMGCSPNMLTLLAICIFGVFFLTFIILTFKISFSLPGQDDSAEVHHCHDERENHDHVDVSTRCKKVALMITTAVVVLADIGGKECL